MDHRTFSLVLVFVLVGENLWVSAARRRGGRPAVWSDNRRSSTARPCLLYTSDAADE